MPVSIRPDDAGQTPEHRTVSWLAASIEIDAVSR
jgi:hypothetical protein